MIYPSLPKSPFILPVANLIFGQTLQYSLKRDSKVAFSALESSFGVNISTVDLEFSRYSPSKNSASFGCGQRQLRIDSLTAELTGVSAVSPLSEVSPILYANSRAQINLFIRLAYQSSSIPNKYFLTISLFISSSLSYPTLSRPR